MRFKIASEIIEAYPQLRIGVIVGRGLSIAKASPDLRALINANIENFVARFRDNVLEEHPNIVAWRETYKSFGVKPKNHRPTAEALLRRVLKDAPFPNVNTAVDAYLAVELIHLLPIGGYDLHQVDGDITLRKSAGGEPFVALGGEAQSTKPGEVVYADSQGVITRMWNYRDCERARITESSTEIILAVEAAYDSVPSSDLRGTADLIVDYAGRFCGGTYSSFLLDSATTEVML